MKTYSYIFSVPACSQKLKKAKQHVAAQKVPKPKAGKILFKTSSLATSSSSVFAKSPHKKATSAGVKKKEKGERLALQQPPAPSASPSSVLDSILFSEAGLNPTPTRVPEAGGGGGEQGGGGGGGGKKAAGEGPEPPKPPPVLPEDLPEDISTSIRLFQEVHKLCPLKLRHSKCKAQLNADFYNVHQ